MSETAINSFPVLQLKAGLSQEVSPENTRGLRQEDFAGLFASLQISGENPLVSPQNTTSKVATVAATPLISGNDFPPQRVGLPNKTSSEPDVTTASRDRGHGLGHQSTGSVTLTPLRASPSSSVAPISEPFTAATLGIPSPISDGVRRAISDISGRLPTLPQQPPSPTLRQTVIPPGNAISDLDIAKLSPQVSNLDGAELASPVSGAASPTPAHRSIGDFPRSVMGPQDMAKLMVANEADIAVSVESLEPRQPDNKHPAALHERTTTLVPASREAVAVNRQAVIESVWPPQILGATENIQMTRAASVGPGPQKASVARSALESGLVAQEFRETDPLESVLASKSALEGSALQKQTKINVMSERSEPTLTVSQTKVASNIGPEPTLGSSADAIINPNSSTNPVTLTSSTQKPTDLNPQVLNFQDTAQFQEKFGDQLVLMTRNGIQNAKISLNPQELGPLEIRLAIKHDEIAVQLASQHGLVRDALDEAYPRLREMFDQIGLKLGQYQVAGEFSERGSSPERYFEQTTQDSQHDDRNQEDDLSAQFGTTRPQPENGIDTYI